MVRPKFDWTGRVAICAALIPAGVFPAVAGGPGASREISFEQRVEAQRAIDRVYHVHQIDAPPFDTVYPEALRDRRVRDTLKESAALEQFWHAGVTREALARELARIAGKTRLPERLDEIYDALGRDPLLVQETFVRAVLVERQARSYFASDAALHAGARREAQGIRERLATGALDPYQPHPLREVTEVSLAPDDTTLPPRGAGLALPRQAFARLRAAAPAGVGAAGPVLEERDRFVVQVVLDEEADRFRLATWTIPKRSWDDWWNSMRDRFDADSVSTVAEPTLSLPEPGPAVAQPESIESICVADDTWNNGSLDEVPASRTDHTAVWTGSVMIVWGGYGGTYLNSGGRYDPLTDSWTPTSLANAPLPRALHTAVWTGSRMIVWGGSDDASTMATGGRYDPLTDTWASMATNKAPTLRNLHTAVWTGSLMVVWGGSSGSGPLATGARYNPSNDTWTAVQTTGAPLPRFNHSAVWTGGVMVIWGGANSSAVMNTGGRYNPANDTWQTGGVITTGAPAARSLHTAVWTGGAMVVWGGTDFTGNRLGSGGRYDPIANTWTGVDELTAPSPRSAHAAVWTGTRMLVWGGTGMTGPLDTGARYDPIANLWTPMTGAGAPAARASATGVWTGSVLVVWGGTVGSTGGLDTGGRYDPAADTWAPTLNNTSPTARLGHTIIWTGNVMVVWGGTSGAGVVATGGRYDPLADLWVDTATAGAPSARANHTAIWTGSRMVIWGGQSFSYLATGARYDPVNDAWSLMASGGAPTGRAYHTAVWTGSVMVIWGGYDISYLASGARYDPVGNSWSGVNAAGAPSGRYLHTAVWTNSRMLVWGGYAGVPLADGREYDPVGDGWITTPSGSLVARYNHTAVWTGARMVVWGGFGTAPLNTGGLYDPVARTWTATTTSGAPTARSLHTATWTGTRMIVWGGQDAAGSLNTGGRYDPVALTWQSMSSVGAPSPRDTHRAVWADGFLLVWGGQDVTGALSTGGRYALGQNVDADNDGVRKCAGDCDDANPAVWAAPGEATDLVLSVPTGSGDTILMWTPPAATGGTAPLSYDTLRSGTASDFGSAAQCVESADGSDTMAVGGGTPDPSTCWFYLVRARNACPAVTGPLGYDSTGAERTGRPCP